MTTKRRPSRLYHLDTYSGGWLLSAPDIKTARRKALKALLNHRFSGGYVVKRATKSHVEWGYSRLFS